jgi:hypothetical protein
MMVVRGERTLDTYFAVRTSKARKGGQVGNIQLTSVEADSVAEAQGLLVERFKTSISPGYQDELKRWDAEGQRIRIPGGKIVTPENKVPLELPPNPYIGEAESELARIRRETGLDDTSKVPTRFAQLWGDMAAEARRALERVIAAEGTDQHQEMRAKAAQARLRAQAYEQVYHQAEQEPTKPKNEERPQAPRAPKSSSGGLQAAVLEALDDRGKQTIEHLSQATGRSVLRLRQVLPEMVKSGQIGVEPNTRPQVYVRKSLIVPTPLEEN